MTNPRVKPIKKALAEKYGYKNVSVRNGQGTATGWVEANIQLPKPDNCYCKPDEPYCRNCGEFINSVSEKMNKIAYEALKENNLKFYTYSSDDGYNTEYDEFLLQVSLT